MSAYFLDKSDTSITKECEFFCQITTKFWSSDDDKHCKLIHIVQKYGTVKVSKSNIHKIVRNYFLNGRGSLKNVFWHPIVSEGGMRNVHACLSPDNCDIHPPCSSTSVPQKCTDAFSSSSSTFSSFSSSTSSSSSPTVQQSQPAGQPAGPAPISSCDLQTWKQYLENQMIIFGLSAPSHAATKEAKQFWGDKSHDFKW